MASSNDSGRPPFTVTSALRSAALLCAVVLVGSAHTAQAGINVWTSHGPEGGMGLIRALAIDPTTPRPLYAAGSSVFAIAQISACVASCFDGNECVR